MGDNRGVLEGGGGGVAPCSQGDDSFRPRPHLSAPNGCQPFANRQALPPTAVPTTRNSVDDHFCNSTFSLLPPV